MSFFIAQRNNKTRMFELLQDRDKPEEFWNESDAINVYQKILKLEGSNNVELLESVILDVDLTVKRYNREGDKR